MVHCCVKNCNSRTEKRVSLFRFPRENLRRSKWVHNMRRESWLPPPEARLCEKHFKENQFEKNGRDGYKKLKPNAVPTLFDPQPIENSPDQKSIYVGLMLDMRKHEIYKKQSTTSPEEVINPSTSAPAEELHLHDVLVKIEELKRLNELQQKENEQQKNKIEQQQNEIISSKETIQDFILSFAVLENRNRELLEQVLDTQKENEQQKNKIEQQLNEIISLKETIQDFISNFAVLENRNRELLGQVLDMQKA